MPLKRPIKTETMINARKALSRAQVINKISNTMPDKRIIRDIFLKLKNKDKQKSHLHLRMAFLS